MQPLIGSFQTRTVCSCYSKKPAGWRISFPFTLPTGVVNSNFLPTIHKPLCHTHLKYLFWDILRNMQFLKHLSFFQISLFSVSSWFKSILHNEKGIWKAHNYEQFLKKRHKNGIWKILFSGKQQYIFALIWKLEDLKNKVF